ncbi:DUF664 domain-containing protein [Lapillicoccus sp.]|uniref:mycothiol transferase n=1 Tax=Lapillicoccus sp. TaxID=1909287 RepID=UPI003983A804
MQTTLPQADPPVPTTRAGSELTLLRSWLDFHGQTLRWKVGGLTPQQAATASVDPSGLSLLGPVRHLTDCERWWFRVVGGGRSDLEEIFPEEGEDLLHASAKDAFDDLARFEEEDAAADAVLERADLDAQAVPPRYGDDVLDALGARQKVEEHARHNGHADLMRKRIDGATGDR